MSTNRTIPASSSTSSFSTSESDIRKKLERELARVQRELDLVRGKSEGKMQSLEENLERANLSVSTLKVEIARLAEINIKQSQELHVLQDSIIDQANEISTLKTRQRLMDQELARKDKDAKELMGTMRRYKSRVEYLKSKVKKTSSRARRGSDDTGSLVGSAGGDESPYNSVIGGPDSSIHGSSFLGGTGGGMRRRDSIPFPGYMTSEEEYFRLVVMAAKLNVSGSTTPSVTNYELDTVSVTPSSSLDCSGMISFRGIAAGPNSSGEEVYEQDIDARIMYSKLVSEQVPFHKWHQWAQEDVMTHRMPALIGMESVSFDHGGAGKKKEKGFKKLAQKLMKLIPTRKSKKRASIGVAAGGDGIEVC